MTYSHCSRFKIILTSFFRFSIGSKGQMLMREYNEVMNKYYDPEKCVFFENALQSNAYIFRGNAELQAVLDSKRNPGRFVFAFLISDHKRLREKWKNHEL